MKKIKQHWLKICIIFIILIISMFVISYFHDKDNCSEVAVIYIDGSIVSSPNYNDDGSPYRDEVLSLDVISQIREAQKDKKVKAIVFVINSTGGESQSGEEIARAMEEINKPTVALIRAHGQSSAYIVASATGRIFASDASDVGSIGITMSYLDNSKYNQENGLIFNQLSSGKYKDTGNTDKPLTEDERELLMTQVNEHFDLFIKRIVKNRNLSEDKVRSLADGATISADKALKEGLIDEIGSFTEVENYLSKILKRKIEICIPVHEIEKNNNYENKNTTCSEHEAGYQWAKENLIDDSEYCEGNSESFIDGCVSYVKENN